MASRDIADCDPRLQKIIPLFLHACHVEKIEILIYCTYRSNEEQDALYAIGRSKPGRIVTNARAGQSMHNCKSKGKPASKAFDCVPMVNGKPCWDQAHHADLYERMGRIGESLGLEWAGRWVGFKEYVHLQLKN